MEEKKTTIFDDADEIRMRLFHYLKDDGRKMNDLTFLRLIYLWISLNDLVNKIAYDGHEEDEEDLDL